MGRMDGKVVFITGAGRGQGRSHALVLAREGAAGVVVTDICEDIPEMAPNTTATQADLDETERLVKEIGVPCLAIKADARRSEEMAAAVQRTIEQFGRIDVLAVNHGVAAARNWQDQTDEFFDATIETDLSAAWRVTKAVLPHMVEQGSGSIIFTSSVSGVQPFPTLTAYSAAKAGLIGLMKSLANELGPHSIRVNAVLPGATGTSMLLDQHVLDGFRGGPGGTIEDVRFPARATFLLPVDWLDPEDISHGVLFLASDEARRVTGVVLPIDGGTLAGAPGIPPVAAERIGALQWQIDNPQPR
ncbi:NAD(P)-dependent oxidoreductase [Nocardioides immobilis]|uniref:NAD(P)-dependent oxidoreductase n=1 Tax=Nocardioides immobilis TaxID=2049295 RepID=A0A417Y0Z0_9ACTN|nr:mycofactocin-coupled SDR family oxidoreductase [Nocardioides immobilis]RHW26227.1 NAD(P)-dependent oxidoreductase [Nocardioides immobilis]